MNDTERRLADWLQAATPEPPRAFTAAAVIDRAGRPAESVVRSGRRAWVSVFAAAAVVAVIVIALVVAAAVRSDHRSLPSAPSPTPRVSTPAPSPSVIVPAASSAPVPKDYPALRLVGAAGNVAWSLSNTLSVSTDGAATWSKMSLPTGVRASAIDSVDVDAKGVVWLQVDHVSAIDLYRGDGRSWRHTHVTVDQPSEPPGLPAPSEYAFSTQGSTVAIMVGGGTDQIHGYADLLLSTDGGASFVQRPSGIVWGVHSMTFVNPQVGLAVAGPTDNYVYRTTNGGRNWTQLFGGPPSANIVYGPPTVTGNGVELPRFTYADGGRGDQYVAVLLSTDLGVTFKATGSTPLRTPEADVTADPEVSIRGSDVWVVGNGRVYESVDDGRTWSTIRTAQPLDAIDVVSPTQAIGQASADCSSDVPGEDCRSQTYLVVTTDGGRTWRSL